VRSQPCCRRPTKNTTILPPHRPQL
jgi:hypothetical protein